MRLSCLVGTLCLTLAQAAPSSAAAGPAQRRAPSARQPERPDMPPGVPARLLGRRTPGIASSRIAAAQRGGTPIIYVAQVNVDEAGNNIVGDAANEPSIAVDPTNPNRIVIGFRQFDTVFSNFRQGGYAYSRDNGRTWTFPGVLEDGVFRSDPVLGSASDGFMYYNSLTGNFLGDVWRSYDQGRTFPEAISAFGGDKTWMVVDHTNSIGRDNIYASWSSNAACCAGNVFTRSIDSGSSWMTPIAIPNTPIFGTLAVGPDGEVYIIGVAAPGNFANMYVDKSLNARDGLVTPTFTSVAISLGGDMSLGGPVNPDGLLGQAWIACDTSNTSRRGYVYALCSVDPPGPDPLDVKFIRSVDGGQNWSAPIRLNDDPVGTNAWQWFGTMSVAPNGRIDVIWNDTRDDPGNVISSIYYTNSSDGGQTWSPNVALTNAFDPRLGYPQQNKIGDYYHMISDDVGAYLACAATFNGEQDVYFIRIGDFDCNANGVSDTIDILSGTVTDYNNSLIPDRCEYLGDANCDELVDVADVGPFVLKLTNPAAYGTSFGGCPIERTDINGDGLVNGDDIGLFVSLLLLP